MRGAGSSASDHRKHLSWGRAAFALCALLVLWAIAGVLTADRMQGDRFELWLDRFSPSPLQLTSYRSLRRAFEYDQFAADVRRDGPAFYVTIRGFDPVPLDDRLAGVLRSRPLHDSLALGLYSLRFGLPMLDAFERTGDLETFRQLARATETVLDASERFTLPPESMAFNDHAVAERTEFLLLFLAKLEEIGQLKDLQVRLRRHVLHNARLLADNRRFTWETNHGLMQIRALLHVAMAAPDSTAGRHSLAVAIERIREMLPFLVAEDGAILEAASGYWLFIYNEWKYIAAMPVLPQAVRRLIEERLTKSRRFLETVVNCEGFLQGMGDSYSRRLQGTDGGFAGRVAEAFMFSNGLAGFEYPFNDSCAQVLFVSLDTPPAVHKMPEDLALYIFAGEPFFSNPGVYAYEDSAKRRYVLAPESQSTVGWVSGNQFWSSRIGVSPSAPGELGLRGEKASADGKIIRNIRFAPATGRLEIVDRSEREVRARFNIHPNVTIEEIDANELLLKGRKTTLRLHHNGRRSWSDRWIARENFKQTPIRQLSIIGNPVTITLDLPRAATSWVGGPVATAGMYRKRADLAHELSRKYRLSTLSRSESATRFIKIRAALLVVAIGTASLFLFTSLAALAWGTFVLAAAFLIGDAATAGFLTTGLATVFQPLAM